VTSPTTESTETDARPRDRQAVKSTDQVDAYRSPWSVRERIGIKLFAIVWALTCAWTPRPLNVWRLLVLRLFGCRITGRPFVAPSVTIRIPWQLELHHRAAIGDHAEIYNLGECVLRERCTVAQYTYLCGGSHDLTRRALPLTVASIDIGADAFIGAKAFVMLGVHIGEGAVVGAASVVVKDVAPWTVVAGNPAVPIGERSFID
jgi:putative colanic acid biosynthesis acetyltransferase WcaF